MAVDLAVMLADGGETITDLAVLRDQREVFGPVAATPTAREIAWLQAADTRDGIPASRAGGRDLPCLVLDLDATLVTCHSEKEQAAAAYKRGFGYHPLLCFLHHIRALPDRVSGTRPWNRTDPCATEQRPPS
ncbi:transposase [Streptomyces canus]|uniref:transposase n=1 Tax=Streptomyces canus TaxID=58343 RepID=UPI0027D79ACD|nr:transposase [Streptomyces canus]